MKFLISALIILMALNCSAQVSDLQKKLDSILDESALLYRYEKAAWEASDLIKINKKLRKKFGGYLVFHNEDTVKVSMLDKRQGSVIARYNFSGGSLEKVFEAEGETLPLSPIEQKLWDIKTKMADQLTNPEYQLTIPQGFRPNLILIEEDAGFKLYVLMGTEQSGIIPFGNDYLFRADLQGEILKWQKFHSRLIPSGAMAPGGGEVLSIMHSHRRSTPYITATDICTFRLYAPATKLKEFSVYSPALGKYMVYNIENNTIQIDD